MGPRFSCFPGAVVGCCTGPHPRPLAHCVWEALRAPFIRCRRCLAFLGRFPAQCRLAGSGLSRPCSASRLDWASAGGNPSSHPVRDSSFGPGPRLSRTQF